VALRTQAEQTQVAMKDSVEVRAFPSELAESVQSVLPLLVEGQLHPPSEGFNAEVRGEFLTIPYRVYYRPERVRNLAQSAREGVIVACLGSTSRWFPSRGVPGQGVIC
jgi:hypothetical protein